MSSNPKGSLRIGSFNYTDKQMWFYWNLKNRCDFIAIFCLYQKTEKAPKALEYFMSYSDLSPAEYQIPVLHSSRDLLFPKKVQKLP